MKYFTFSLIVEFFFIDLFSQTVTFQKAYEYNIDAYIDGNSMAKTTDGGYIVCASGYDYTPPIINLNYSQITKINFSGDTLWSRKISSGQDILLESVRQTSDSGYIACGYTWDSTLWDSDMIMVKLNSLGNLMWSKGYGTAASNAFESANCVRQTSDGGFILAGQVEISSTNSDAAVIKTDANGNIQWTAKFGGAGIDYATQTEQMPDGNFIIGATTNSWGAGGKDFMLAKVSFIGSFIWKVIYGTPSNEQLTSFTRTADGTFILAGHKSSLDSVLVIKTGSTGIFQWAKEYGIGVDSVNIWTNDIIQTGDLGYAFTGGNCNNDFFCFDSYLVKTDSSGNIQFSNHYNIYGFGNRVQGKELLQTTDGGYAFINTAEVLLIKTDSNGTSGCYEYNLPIAYSIPNIQTSYYTLTGTSYGNIILKTVNISPANSTHTFCSTVGMNEFFPESYINIAPNPFISSAIIKIGNVEGRLIFFLYDIYGRNIKTFKISYPETELKRENLPSGIYFWKITCENSTIDSGKLIIE